MQRERYASDSGGDEHPAEALRKDSWGESARAFGGLEKVARAVASTSWLSHSDGPVRPTRTPPAPAALPLQPAATLNHHLAHRPTQISAPRRLRRCRRRRRSIQAGQEDDQAHQELLRRHQEDIKKKDLSGKLTCESFYGTHQVFVKTTLSDDESTTIGRQCVTRQSKITRWLMVRLRRAARLHSPLTRAHVQGPCMKTKSLLKEMVYGVLDDRIAASVKEDCDPPALATKFPKAYMLSHADFHGTYLRIRKGARGRRLSCWVSREGGTHAGLRVERGRDVCAEAAWPPP